MKIEKNVYRKSIHNAFYMDQMNVLSVAKKMHLLLQYLCDIHRTATYIHVQKHALGSNNTQWTYLLKALNAMVTKVYSAYNI